MLVDKSTRSWHNKVAKPRGFRPSLKRRLPPARNQAERACDDGKSFTMKLLLPKLKASRSGGALLLRGAVGKPAQICAAITATMVCFVLLNWAFGNWKVLTLGPGLAPMAPSSAWSMLLLSCGVFAHNRWPARATSRAVAYLAFFGVTAIGLLVSARWLFGVELPVEGWPTSSVDRVGNIPIGRMSPLTATTLLVASLAFLLELPPLDRCWPCRQAASVLALATSLVGIVVLLSYAAGLPLFYGARTTPIALMTAFSFMTLGVGLSADAGADTFPLSLFQATPEVASKPSRYWIVGVPFVIFLILSSGIGTVGYAYFGCQVAVSREATRVAMSAIADLKVRQILKWRQERLGNAQMLTKELHCRRDLQEFLSDSARNEAKSDLLEWLKAICEHNEGLRILLLDQEMSVRLAYPEGKTYFGAIAQSSAVLALRSSEVVMSDLHRSQFSGKIHLDIAIPILRGRALPGPGAPPPPPAGLRPIGVILVEVDPEKFLYPDIQDWPTPSPTAETLLVRREGDEVVFLNELRHKTGTALSLRLPISDSMRIAAQAVRGREKVMEGIDYRDVPVLAATRNDPGTPWFVVAKTDQDEIYAPLRKQGLNAAAFALVLVVVAGLGLCLIGHRRDTQWLRKRLAVEREHRLILDSTDQGVLGLDSQGKHVFVNPAACRMLGYEPGELIGNPPDGKPIIDPNLANSLEDVS